MLATAVSAFGQVPVANFTASPLAGCSPLVVNFQDLSTGSPSSWSWDFGNGNTSVLQNPTATYFIPGNYTVRLTVTNASGSNTLTRTQYLTVYDIPTVNFSADDVNGCFPHRVQFTDLSTGGTGNTNVSWQWDFGNGVTSTLQNPSANYTTAGNFTVTLKVTNDKGCIKTVGRSNFITVTPGVTAGFTNTQPVVCQAPASISFTNTSTGPAVLSYTWNFGDGNNSTLQNPVHVYNAEGIYDVTLVTVSSAGCRDTVHSTIPVTIGGITTSFNSPDTVCANEMAIFTNTATPPPLSSFWRFGDGGTSNQINTTHTYAAPGTYTVTLFNTYFLCTDSTNRTIVVNPLPVANFTAPITTRCQPDLTVNFQDQSTSAVSWQWNFGDGGTSTLQNPTHTYTNYGSFDVTLVVTNALGCNDTLVRPAFVRVARPVITIPGLPTRGCVPYAFTFNPSIVSLDAVTSYLWTFGEGGSSTASNPTYTYPTQGTYTVKLVITTSTGCTDSLIVTDAVRVGTKPVADFTAAPRSVCAFTPVQFTDLSAPADQWMWLFGDGAVSTTQSPSYNYTDTGYFTVTLIATNNGCPDTLVRPDYIHVNPPIARFSFVANCANRLQFTFTDESVDPVSWNWDFGDGTFSTLQDPVHTFPALGQYNVTLTVTNGSCTHSVVHTAQVIDQNPDFTIDDNSVCRGTPVTFTPTNVNPATLATLQWEFGNGDAAATNTNPFTYTYPLSGVYSVLLRIIDVNGCRDSILKTNFVRINGPTANFSVTNGTGCVGNTVTFNDLTVTDGVNALTSWQWDFGDSSSQTFTSPPFTHVYDSLGTFDVSLLVTDAMGCTDSTTRIAIVTTSQPSPDFLSDTLSCPGGMVTFANITQPPGYTSVWLFGDGNSSTANNTTHFYANPGFYTVSLIITDANGCVDTMTKVNRVRVDVPIASFTINDSIGACIPLEVLFTNTSFYSNAAMWYFGDGGTSSEMNPAHYYSVPGTYIAMLEAISPGGCKDSAYATIIVNDTTGSRLDYLPITGCNPLTVNLSTVTTAVIESYFWDFGDGNTITTTSPNISHTYDAFGTYLPKVIMLDPSGCLIPLTGSDTINIRGSTPDFSFTPALICDSGFVVFSDSTLASDPIGSYSWDFGDGGTSTSQNPTHFYSTPGTYDVTLTVTTVPGCQNSFTYPDAITVVLRPLIAIAGDTVVCVNEFIQHSGVFVRPDTSAVTWAWTFPNGNTSTLQTPVPQSYGTAGNFVLTAIAGNSSGCKDTATRNIRVHPLPTSTLPGQMTIQSGYPAQIPVTYSPGVLGWSWLPSQGLDCPDCPSPIAGPRFTTSYQVTYTDSNSCSNRDTILVIVVCKDGNLFMPNTFSPNGDGSNDVFYPRGRGLYNVKMLRIFNRWGEIVFEKRDFAVNSQLTGWDGTFKGKKPQADVYVYQVEVNCDNGEVIKLEGNIALVL
ncbi:MAG: PKD domain-containing protein [Chitinophagaceae bacterium]|nr:PKD domain-containing protein [Chitinophagaceae bacterium]